MLVAIYEKKFLKEVKRQQKRGKDMARLRQIMTMLIEEIPLPPKNRNHKLLGNFKDCWECHIEPDWLLIYRKTTAQEIIFLRTGTHSDLF